MKRSTIYIMAGVGVIALAFAFSGEPDDDLTLAGHYQCPPRACLGSRFGIAAEGRV